MPYGTIFSDAFQGSTANTAPVIYDGNSREIGTFCKSWLNHNGATSTIRTSFNVSSVTSGTGDYTVNFTNAMTDSSYSSLINTNRSSGNTTLANISRLADELTSPTTTAARFAQGVPDASRVLQREAASFVSVAIFR